MRITRHQLQQIINEEISSVLQRLEHRQLIEAVAEVEAALDEDFSKEEVEARMAALGSAMKAPAGKGRVMIGPGGSRETMKSQEVKIDPKRNAVIFSPEQAEEIKKALKIAGFDVK